MNKIYFLFFFSLFSFAFAQKNTQAEFPGGYQAFQKEFMYMVHSYVDTKIYGVDGKFVFTILIDSKGKMSDLKISPKVRNNQEFVQDMTFAMERIKKKWKPATSNNIPIPSTITFNINFTTDFADHGD